MEPAVYPALIAQARRHARRADEVDDLVQQTLLAGLEAGRADLPWLSGTLANLAALQARGAGRRRRREAAVAADTEHAQAPPAPAEPSPDTVAAVLAALPPAARRVAVLALHGLGAAEIKWLLGIPDTAFRQRLARIRRGLGELPPVLRAEALVLAYVRDPARAVELQFGLVRRALQAVLALRPGLGTHDADGHLLVIHRGAHVPPPRGNG
mgnify:CR=1 FL=1